MDKKKRFKVIRSDKSMYSVATKMQKDTVSDKLLELRNRAIIRMNCADLRHTPNLHDIMQANENAADMAKDQYKTIKLVLRRTNMKSNKSNKYSLSEFIKENRKLIDATTPRNPVISKDDEWNDKSYDEEFRRFLNR